MAFWTSDEETDGKTTVVDNGQEVVKVNNSPSNGNIRDVYYAEKDGSGNHAHFWTSSDGSKGGHNNYENLTHYSSDYDDDDDDSGDCYITTASLQGQMAVSALDVLKEWRYSVLERFALGDAMSNYYRCTAKPIAGYVKKHKHLGMVLRILIVKPALYWAKREPSALKNVILFTLFCVGLFIAECIKICRRV